MPADKQTTVEQQMESDDIEVQGYTRRETMLTMLAVMLVMLLASLGQTIVATSVPYIIGDLQGFDRYTWVTISYLLTSTVMVPIYGKLSDLFGRKAIFLVGVIVFLIGSGLCGAAQTIDQLIVFRGLQGVGAAALIPIAMAVIGDLFPPRERGKWQGLTGAVFGLSSVLGPMVGGWISENMNWRWVFYANLPLGFIGLLVLIFLMPSLQQKTKKLVRIDYIGSMLLALGTVPLLLGLSWADTMYPWGSWQVITLIVGGLVGLLLFFVYESYLESRDKQPILDPGMFKDPVVTVSVLISMVVNMAMFAGIFFLPLYAQGVLGISATNSGLILSPLMLSLILGSIIAGQIVSRLGKYKIIAITGMIISALGALLLLRLDVNSIWIDLLFAMMVMGVGMGFSMPIYTLIVQNALPTKIGQATSALTFFRQIGSTIALAALGSIMTAAYKPTLNSVIPQNVRQFADQMKQSSGRDILTAFDNPNVLLDQNTQQQLINGFSQFGPQGVQIYNDLMSAVKIAITQGIHNVFVVSLIFMVVGLVLVFFLKEIPLRGGKSKIEKVAIENSENRLDTVTVR